MAKLSTRSQVTGGPDPDDWFHFIRSNGDSPETFSSFKAQLLELLALVSNLYDIPLSYAGTPDAGALIGKLIAVRDIVFPANFSGSSGHVGTNPAATFDIDVQDDGASIGNISISTSGVFTFTTTSGTEKTVVAGSRIEFYADTSSPADASIAEIAATLKGTVV